MADKPGRIAFIGAGTMGGTIARGLVSSGYPATDIAVTSRSPQTRQKLADEIGVQAIDTNAEASAWADTVMIGVKPADAGAVLDQISDHLGADTLVVSLCAGLSCASLEEHLPEGAHLVRVMPNTPSSVGAGMSGVVAGSNASHDDIDHVIELMSAVGKAVTIPEKQMDALSAISGSGPAYVYYFIDAVIEAGVTQGLPRGLATTLAVQTFLGSAELLAQTGQHPALAREAVTSPGGTTAAGLWQLDSHGVRGAIQDAIAACTARSAELGKSS